MRRTRDADVHQHSGGDHHVTGLTQFHCLRLRTAGRRTKRLRTVIDEPDIENPLAIVIPEKTTDEPACIAILSALRAGGVIASMAYKGKSSKRFDIAKKSGASLIINVDSTKQVVPSYTEVRISPLTLSEVGRNEAQEKIVKALQRRFEVRSFTLEERIDYAPIFYLSAIE